MPSYTIIAVPILVAIVSGWLCDDELGDGANSVISLIILVGMAWLWSLVSMAIIADQAANIVAIVAFSLALITPITPLYFARQWLIAHTRSPLAKLPTITISVRTPPPAEQRSSSGLSNPGQRWTANPPTPPPTTWQPSRRGHAQINHVDTLSIPAIPAPQPPSSQPLTLRPPMYPPQKGTPYS